MNSRHAVLLLCLLGFAHSANASPIQFYQGGRPAAGNPAHLHLFPEAGILHGWISGLEDLAGKEIEVREDGELVDAIEIGRNNQFSWSLKPAQRDDASKPEARTVTLVFSRQERTVTIPPAAVEQPVAFFVVDRSVFRPQTELKFAAFLRTMNAEGSWQPFVSDSAVVEIRSLSKDILVAKLEVEPDAFGRITGSYKFSKADPHDEYRISVKGAGGSATVKVAEFRKAKVRLDISSERDGEELTLKFRALDFLNKPVPASKLRFTARIVRKPAPATDLWG